MTAKGCCEVLKPSDATKAATPEHNILAYNDLILSCQDDISFGIIEESVSETYPDGDAMLAWKNLSDSFEPKTGAAKVQLKQEFHQLKLTSADEDPDPWITLLELKRRRLKTHGSTIEDISEEAIATATTATTGIRDETGTTIAINRITANQWRCQISTTK